LAETLTFEDLPETPDLDLYDLARRLRSDVDLMPPEPSARQGVGEKETFWAIDLDTNKPFQVTAVLRASTPHADFYVQEDLRTPVSNAAVQEAARAYEEEIYPQVTGLFRPQTLGVDEEPLTLLHMDLPAVAGYYDSTDEYPEGVFPYTNGRRMLYLNVNFPYTPGSQDYVSLVAHELQHAIHWEADDTDEVWINEGLSVLAGALFESSEFLVPAFLRSLSPTQLTTWPGQASSAAVNYGAAGLLMEFIHERYPSRDGTLRPLVAEPKDGLAGLEAYLTQEGHDIGWRDLLAEWAAANYLDGRSDWDPYPDREPAVAALRTVATPGTIDVQATQFGATYIDLDLPPGDYRMVFEGEPLTSLLPIAVPPESGIWWSGGEDAADATLTRRFDLTDVEEATLNLRLWHDIEKDWDFLYVLASGDGGATWEFLETPSMVSAEDNILGQAFGPGYSGRSGDGAAPRWAEETIDLSPYAGEEVLIRLEYVTDGAVNMEGVAIGAVSVPEIDYSWEGEDGGGWESRGFFLSNGWAQQEFEVRLLLVRPDGGHEIIQPELDDAQDGEIVLRGFGDTYTQAALLVFPLAPVTRQFASFSLETSALP
jgi:hypothetical protein